MKVPDTSTMFTNLACKLSSVCVCVLIECSQTLSMCASISQVSQVTQTHTLHGYLYTQHNMSDRRIKQSDRKIICRLQLPRRIYIYLEGWYILRGSTISFVDIFRAHRRIYIILRWPTFRLRHFTNIFLTVGPSQTRRTVDLVNLQH
ncbi:hypothetical protein Hanom_Chr15g01356381 [Helianthus anomalus]